MPGLGPRFTIEAGLIIAVAVVAALVRLGTITIILVMAATWLLMAAVELVISRSRARPAPEAMLVPAEPLEQRREPPAVRTVPPPPVVSPRIAPVPESGHEPVVDERREPEPAPAPEPDVTPGPSLEPAPEPGRDEPPEPAPPETPPEQPRVAIVAAAPEPERQPELPTSELESRLVPFTSRSLGVPQQWNLWELERVARERSGADAVRDEERSFLLMYLRDFADADGVLPTSFDAIVRESFGDALDAVGA
jgi:hypothetical protein